jgi:hypothetical protein
MILIPIDHIWPERAPESTGTGTAGPYGTGIDSTGAGGTGGFGLDFIGGLPLPRNQHDTTPRNSTLSDTLDQANILRRARFKPAYATLGVEWVFTVAEYATFQQFWSYLGNGCAQFRIPLRYPEDSILTPWIVRFLGEFTSQPLDGMWSVKAKIELTKKGYVNDVSAPHGYTLLRVEDTADTGGTHQEIRFRDGKTLYVRS